MSAWLFLVHARDHIWRDRSIPLEVRAAACDVLWNAAIRAAREGGRV